VTEEGGWPARRQRTFTLIAGTDACSLSGRKKWATLSSAGGVALVVASIGTDTEGRNQLRVARVDLGSPGVNVVAMPPTPFVPEIQHCRLEFDDVRITADQFLPGDGYTRYVRPFRTLEDTHIGCGILGYLLSVAFRYDWPHALREEMLHLIVGLRSLALGSAAPPRTSLEGLLHFRGLLQRAETRWRGSARTNVTVNVTRASHRSRTCASADAEGLGTPVKALDRPRQGEKNRIIDLIIQPHHVFVSVSHA
jgi:hypothetical protein